MKIGVLALQGAFAEHMNTLGTFDIDVCEVRKPEQLEGLDGMVIPGGESTAIGKLMVEYRIFKPLKKLCNEGFPVFGTCAGMVLLSKEIQDGMPGQPSLGVLDVVTQRNAFGRQVDSFEKDLDVPELGSKKFPGVFIRAPIIKAVKNGAKIMAKVGDEIVAVREKKLLATSFHPELTEDNRFHNYFIKMIKEGK